MTCFICKTCGTEYPEANHPPETCPICSDERQYIGWNGQEWTSLADLSRDHQNEIRPVEPGLYGIGTQPAFAIGQRALLVQTPEGNLLWDCISLIDEDTVKAVEALGGIHAIAISHPHFYSSMLEWAEAFHAPVYLHELNRPWVMRPDSRIRFWKEDALPLFGRLTLVRCGGHFPGGTVAHWPSGASGKGALLSGDILYVVQDHRYVSFMYSYPNLIPLPASSVRKIVQAVEPFAYERIYAAWWDRTLHQDARAAVLRSAQRYISILEGTRPVD